MTRRTLARVVAFVRQEPVATALLPLVAALVSYLVSRGVVTEALAPIILAVVAGVLGVSATAVVRSQVTPVVKVDAKARAQIGAVIDTAAREIGPQLGPETRKAVEVLAAQAKTYVGQHRADG